MNKQQTAAPAKSQGRHEQQRGGTECSTNNACGTGEWLAKMELFK